MRNSKLKTTAKAKTGAGEKQGKLKIGDQWNAITIIASSQNNPLKAIAEFVENAIDAGAANVSIVRGKQRGEQYLKVIDDGSGVADFRYVATHIGDSIKRKLKANGATGLQGEFGIGLLSFWTIGEELTMSSVDAEGVGRRMRLVKGNPSYSIKSSGNLFDRNGTELDIRPLLPGVRMLSGEKIQAYLASELRDRISRSGVRIRILDRASRKDLLVEPRRFTGRLLHNLPELRCPQGEVYLELYINEPSSDHEVGLYKNGTRVIPDITRLDALDRPPWNQRYLEGILDAEFLQLTPGTRDGIILDAAYDSLLQALSTVEPYLSEVIEEKKRAQEEEASKSIMRKVTRALKEAFLMLPREEYGWLSAQAKTPGRTGVDAGAGTDGDPTAQTPEAATPPEAQEAAESAEYGEPGLGMDAPNGEPATPGAAPGPDAGTERRFFDFPGPLYRLTVSPASSAVGIGESRKLHAVARDKARRPLDADVEISWRVLQGGGTLSAPRGEFIEYRAPEEPELATIEATARQGERECRAEAVVTVTAELLPRGRGADTSFKHGLPGYTYKHAPGELWRSTYRVAESIIVINKAHADFVFASRQTATKLRYIARLYAKEIVLANFPEASKEDLLERLVELVLYMEDNLK